MEMKIINGPIPDKFCIFCKYSLNGKHLIEMIYTMPTGNNKKKTYQVHLTCGNKFLKEWGNTSYKEKELLNLLHTKYNKEMICETLEGIGEK